MERLPLSANKSNLLRLKDELAFARDGLELLDEKKEALMARISSLSSKAERVRARMDGAMEETYGHLREAILAHGRMDCERASLGAAMDEEIQVREKSYMGVALPLVTIRFPEFLPAYGFHGTGACMDAAAKSLYRSLRALRNTGIDSCRERERLACVPGALMRGGFSMKQIFRNIACMMHQADPNATFAFEFWDGETVAFGDLPRVTLRMKTKGSARQILKKGFLGLGETYMFDEVEVEGDLRELLRLGFAIKFDANASRLMRLIQALAFHPAAVNTPERARRDISCHYDLGNEFYSLFLDETMTYSCAYFKDCCESLEQAQLNKYEHIARKLMLKPGERLVDIGCGWGGMLIHAAQNYGVTGMGNTLSRGQYEYAGKKVRELGLQDRIEVVLQDYRQITGRFDKLVSIGMFEHVGRELIPVFMQKVSGLLKTGGLGLLHTIGKDVYSITDPWTTQYIFPGGYIPNLPEIVQHMGANGFTVLDVENLRLHYRRTLDRWADNFERNADRVRKMFDETFVRMWRLYLLSSWAGFSYGDTRLFQVLFSNGLNNETPMTREHVYRHGA